MAMRTNCRNYESRTYASGEIVRMCRLDLAPEAPWKCPEDCPAFEPKIVDVGWVKGSLADKATPGAPDLGDDVAQLLDHAESVINQIGPDVVAEVQAQRKRERAQTSWWNRVFRRR